MEAVRSKAAVGLPIRLFTFVLSLSSVGLMATASQCTVLELDGVVFTVTYSPFLFLAGLNSAAVMLEAAGMFLVLSNGGGGGAGGEVPWGGGTGRRDGAGNGIMLMTFIDSAVMALLYGSAAVTCAAAYAYRRHMTAWAVSGGLVHRSKLGLSLTAVFAVGLAVVVKKHVLVLSRSSF